MFINNNDAFISIVNKLQQLQLQANIKLPRRTAQIQLNTKDQL